MTQQKFCPNCGAKLENDANFCTSCGVKIQTNIAQSQPVIEQQVTYPQPVNQQNVQQGVAKPKINWWNEFWKWIGNSFIHPGKAEAKAWWFGFASEILILICIGFILLMSSVFVGSQYALTKLAFVTKFLIIFLVILLNITISYLIYIIFYDKRMNLIQYNNFIMQHSSYSSLILFIGAFSIIITKDETSFLFIMIGLAFFAFELANIIVYFHFKSENARLYFISSLLSSLIVYSDCIWLFFSILSYLNR